MLDFNDCAIFGDIFRGVASPSGPGDCLDVNADGSVGMLDLLVLYQTILQSPNHAVHAPQETYLSGDIDGNQAVDRDDVLLLQQYLGTEVPGSFRVSIGDIDGDGKLDQHDAFLLQQSVQ